MACRNAPVHSPLNMAELSCAPFLLLEGMNSPESCYCVLQARGAQLRAAGCPSSLQARRKPSKCLPSCRRLFSCLRLSSFRLLRSICKGAVACKEL